MNQPSSIRVEDAREPVGAPLFYGTGLALGFVAYSLVFWFTATETFGHALLSAFRNVASLAIIAWPTHHIVSRWVVHRSFASQLLLHVPIAIAFSLLWYWLLLVFIGLSEGEPTAFEVERFLPTSGIRWQLLQGATYMQ